MFYAMSGSGKSTIRLFQIFCRADRWWVCDRWAGEVLYIMNEQIVCPCLNDEKSFIGGDTYELKPPLVFIYWCLYPTLSNSNPLAPVTKDILRWMETSRHLDTWRPGTILIFYIFLFCNFEINTRGIFFVAVTCESVTRWKCPFPDRLDRKGY